MGKQIKIRVPCWLLSDSWKNKEKLESKQEQKFCLNLDICGIHHILLGSSNSFIFSGRENLEMVH